MATDYAQAEDEHFLESRGLSKVFTGVVRVQPQCRQLPCDPVDFYFLQGRRATRQEYLNAGGLLIITSDPGIKRIETEPMPQTSLPPFVDLFPDNSPGSPGGVATNIPDLKLPSPAPGEYVPEQTKATPALRLDLAFGASILYLISRIFR